MLYKSNKRVISRKREVRIVLAEFIGTNGSMGFKKGKIYNINIKEQLNVIVLRTMDGKLWCPYSSMEAFYKNWKILLRKRN